jgi:hypothetical protein
VEVGLSEIKRVPDPQSRPPQDHDQRSQPSAIGTLARGAHHCDDVLHGRRIRTVPVALVSRGETFVKASHRDGRPTMTGSVI